MENNYSLVNRIPNLIDTDRATNELTDREAMGLSNHYQFGDLESKLEDCYIKISELSKFELVRLLENKFTPFLERFVSGQLLSLLGDTRINTLDPLMIEIPSWSGYLGLDSKDVQRVTDDLKNIGIMQSWIEKETPKYYVQIKAFRVGKYLVTNKEYLDFLKDSNYEEIPTSWRFGQYPHHFANHPVYTLSDNACVAYCDWLSKTTGRKFRLPSEAEWEYSAGGPEGLEFPWGELFDSDCANTVESGIYQSTPVGIFPKGDSCFGCSDMAGNVEEYVSDYYKSYNNDKNIVDDLLLVNGDYRVARGGSFTRFRDLARNKRRHGRYPKEIYVMGFRLAEDY